MAAASGVCPQRRVLVDDSYVRVDARDLDVGQLGHLASFKHTVLRHSWWDSSRRFVKVFAILVLSLFVITGLVIHLSAPLLMRANQLGRQCLEVREGSGIPKKYNFAMVSSSDGSKNIIPHRSFDGLMDIVGPNKKSYAERHGYSFIDASDLLDKSRPPSWSKILAVKEHMASHDWVFWNDVDSVVTNPETTLEGIIDSLVGDMDWEQMPDLIMTEDVGGVNAGMFFVRNSEWSRYFLDLWWNQTDFVQPFGGSKSGDNDALKYLIRTMPDVEKSQHVRITKMQCAFNSNLWRPSRKNVARLARFTSTIWRGAYAKGDFMVHLAGLNDKKKWIQEVLEDIKLQDSAARVDSGVSLGAEVGRFFGRKAGSFDPHRH